MEQTRNFGFDTNALEEDAEGDEFSERLDVSRTPSKISMAHEKISPASTLFVDDMGCLEDRASHCCVNKTTITQWDQWFRDVRVKSLLDNAEQRKIGGTDLVMQKRYGSINIITMIGSSYILWTHS
ncbi:unnamed protein product [Heligmosomoides polygyrus]|uniref:DDE_Tnp_1_7 domain-containing protein n=1 Tax=Heligmosomoides polygyrus TaxID=6339 RepID=A0A183GU12_HELPZ|nr:unnamed protein product [Heligmosomoides polygyrus]